MIKTETLMSERSEQQVGPRTSSIKPILPVVVWDLPNEERTEELVDVLVTRVFERLTIQAKEAFWSNALNEYNNFPKQTSRERRHAENLVTQAASELLKNPQYISIAQETWRRHEAGQNHTEESKDSFPNLVKRECLALIKDKWQGVKPEQLAQLVRIYANNDLSKDFAEDLLKNYFKGPRSRNQRIDVYYTFALGLLDLVEDEAAFTTGVKIVLHDTDILPKDPNLIEQALLLSLPYNEKERVFQKLLIAKYVMFQLSFLSLEDLGEVRQKHYDFLSTDKKLIRKWEEEQDQAIKKMGSAKVAEINNALLEFDVCKKEDLSEEEKLKLKNIWPFNLFFDKADPLNQKFQEVFSQKGEFLNRSKK